MRKGVTKARIDRDWPHQVALPAFRCTGSQHNDHAAFCGDLSLCPRGHWFYRDGHDFKVFCFADPEHARQFCERFGGEVMDPKTRPKWPGSH